MRNIIISTALRCFMASALLFGAAYPAAASSIKDPLGVPATAGFASRVINITPETKYVNVMRNEVVRFVNTVNGRTFTWQFYTLHHPNFDLRKVAPAEFLNSELMVYVGLNPEESN